MGAERSNLPSNPRLGVAADPPPAGVEVVVRGVGVDAHCDRVEAAAAERAGDDRAGKRELGQDVVPSALLVRGDLGLLLLPDQGRHDTLAEGWLARSPRLDDGEEESLDLREEYVLVEGRIVRLDGGDAGKFAVDAITIDVGGPRPGHHLPVPSAARAMQRAVRGREVTLAGRRLTLGQPVRQGFESIDQADR